MARKTAFWTCSNRNHVATNNVTNGYDRQGSVARRHDREESSGPSSGMSSKMGPTSRTDVHHYGAAEWPTPGFLRLSGLVERQVHRTLRHLGQKVLPVDAYHARRMSSQHRIALAIETQGLPASTRTIAPSLTA